MKYSVIFVFILLISISCSNKNKKYVGEWFHFSGVQSIVFLDDNTYLVKSLDKTHGMRGKWSQVSEDTIFLENIFFLARKDTLWYDTTTFFTKNQPCCEVEFNVIHKKCNWFYESTASTGWPLYFINDSTYISNFEDTLAWKKVSFFNQTFLNLDLGGGLNIYLKAESVKKDRIELSHFDLNFNFEKKSYLLINEQ